MMKWQCLIVLLMGLYSSINAQDSTRMILQELSKKEQIDYLGDRLTKEFYSAPQNMYFLAELYDSITSTIDPPQYIYESINFRGNAAYANQDYAGALEFYIKAQIELERTGNNRYGLGLYNNMAACYRFSDESERAISYYEKAYENAVEVEDSSFIAQVGNNLAIQFLEIKEYSKALPYLDNAITIYGAQNNPIYQGISYLTRANLNNEAGRFKASIEDYESAMKLVPESAVPIVHASAYAGKGTIYRKQRRFKDAEKSLKISLEKAKEIKHLEQVKESCRELSTLYEDLGNYKLSMAYFTEYTEAKDSLFTAEQHQRLTDAISKFEVEKKNQEIALLKEREKNGALELKVANRRNLLFGGGLGVLGLLTFLLFKFNKEMKSKNTVISEALDEKEVLLREIHHRVKNNLHFISSLLGLQTDHVSDPAALGALQEGQDRVQSMALIHQNLYQEDNLTGVDIPEYFGKLINGLFDSYNIRQGDIKLEIEVAPLNLDVDTVIPIGLIVNELVSNSLKYAFEGRETGTISINLKEEEGVLKLQVKDDGVGMGQAAKEAMGSSFGYKLVKAFVSQLDANLTVNTIPGTDVRIDIRRYKKAV